MRRQKTGARNRRWPIARAPCPRPECEPGDHEGDPDVLHKMRVEWAGFGYARNAFVSSGTGEEHDQPVGQGRYCKNCGYQSLHGNLLRPKDEPGGLPVTGWPNKVCGCCNPFFARTLYIGAGIACFPVFAPHSQRPDFCSCQQVRKRINSRLRTCWLSLARMCSHSVKPRR